MTKSENQDLRLKRIEECFEEAIDQWNGCDWTTFFGKTGLNLDKMTSAQALLLARATAGKEAEDWRRAVAWLTGVEVDVGDAKGRARMAVMLCRANRWREALEQAQEANRLESRYHRVTVWQPFCEAIEEAIRTRTPQAMATSAHGD